MQRDATRTIGRFVLGALLAAIFFLLALWRTEDKQQAALATFVGIVFYVIGLATTQDRGDNDDSSK